MGWHKSDAPIYIDSLAGFAMPWVSTVAASFGHVINNKQGTTSIQAHMHLWCPQAKVSSPLTTITSGLWLWSIAALDACTIITGLCWLAVRYPQHHYFQSLTVVHCCTCCMAAPSDHCPPDAAATVLDACMLHHHSWSLTILVHHWLHLM